MEMSSMYEKHESCPNVQAQILPLLLAAVGNAYQRRRLIKVVGPDKLWVFEWVMFVIHTGITKLARTRRCAETMFLLNFGTLAWMFVAIRECERFVFQWRWHGTQPHLMMNAVGWDGILAMAPFLFVLFFS